MRVVTNLVFTKDEVERIIPYKLVSETLGGKGVTSRRLAKVFSAEEIEKINTMWAQSRIWYLKAGVPDEVSMDADTLVLWWRLAEFCMVV